MRLEDAPRVDEEDEEGEPTTCHLCGEESPYVLYEGEKMCLSCGYTPGVARTRDDEDDSMWSQWHTHRSETYSGFTGRERVKMVGGFASAYDFNIDF